MNKPVSTPVTCESFEGGSKYRCTITMRTKKHFERDAEKTDIARAFGMKFSGVFQHVWY
jgi:hypothetical protein